MVPRARLELARPVERTQDFKSCASTDFATGAQIKLERTTLLSKF